MIQVKIVNKSNNPLPEYAHVGDAGMDLRANLSEPVTIDPFKRKLIPTGLYIQMPQDDGYCYEAQVRPRSGLALKYGISVCKGHDLRRPQPCVRGNLKLHVQPERCRAVWLQYGHRRDHLPVLLCSFCTGEQGD